MKMEGEKNRYITIGVSKTPPKLPPSLVVTTGEDGLWTYPLLLRLSKAYNAPKNDVGRMDFWDRCVTK